MGSFVVLSSILGYAASRLIERPALAMRDRLFPSLVGGARSNTASYDRMAGELNVRGANDEQSAKLNAGGIS